VPMTFNTLVYATVQPTKPENLVVHELKLREQEVHPLLIEVLARASQNLRATPASEIVFTDDRAPIEQLTNAIALRFIFEGGVDVLR